MHSFQYPVVPRPPSESNANSPDSLGDGPKRGLKMPPTMRSAPRPISFDLQENPQEDPQEDPQEGPQAPQGEPLPEAARQVELGQSGSVQTSTLPQSRLRRSTQRSSGERSQRLGWVAWLGVGLGQVGLAGLVSVGGGAGGIAIAQVWPGAVGNPLSPPLIQRAWSGLDGLIQQAIRLPRQSIVGLANRLDPPPQPRGVVSPLPPIAEGDRPRWDQEIAVAQQELGRLRQRLDGLEAQLGYRYGAASVETRLRLATARVADPTAVELPRIETMNRGELAPSAQTAKTQSLNITLPTDSLFEDTSSTLKPGAIALLSDVAQELRTLPTPPSTPIAIAVHSDNIGSDLTNQELSFRRARIIAQYLADQFEPSYQFIPLGYGATSPIAPNDTNPNRLRNRRLELQIRP